MSNLKTYRDLIVWQKGIDLVKFSCQLTKRTSSSEQFGIISQIQRAAVSVPEILQKVGGRETNNYFIHFLRILKRSLAELDTLMVLGQNLNYIDQDLFIAVSSKIENVKNA